MACKYQEHTIWVTMLFSNTQTVCFIGLKGSLLGDGSIGSWCGIIERLGRVRFAALTSAVGRHAFQPSYPSAGSLLSAPASRKIEGEQSMSRHRLRKDQKRESLHIRMNEYINGRRHTEGLGPGLEAVQSLTLLDAGSKLNRSAWRRTKSRRLATI